MSGNREAGPISAVITTYNDGAVLADALQSVADQTLMPEEILVIDDGSEPPTAPAIIDAFKAETGLAVKYVWQANAGPSAARNTGLDRASQEYVAYLDSDDRWLCDHLERKHFKLSNSDLTYSTAYNGFVEFDDSSGRLLRTIRTKKSYDGPIEEALLGVPDGVPAGMQFQMHRRQALLGVGGFDENLRVNEDFDLLLRLGKAGYRITGSGDATVMRRVHTASHTRVDPQRTLADLERFLQKAEREALLSPAAIASKRKWARLSLGKQQIADAATIEAGINTLRQAFEHDGPRGIQQWMVFWTVKNHLLATLLFGAYRQLRAVTGQVRG